MAKKVQVEIYKPTKEEKDKIIDISLACIDLMKDLSEIQTAIVLNSMVRTFEETSEIDVMSIVVERVEKE